MAAKEIIQTGGAILGLLGGRKQDERQVKQQGRINDVNAKTAKELADYEQQLKLDMWKKTNLSAQVEEAKKAGISLSTFSNGGGSAGQSSGAGVSGVGGGAAADAASTSNARGQMALLGAQIANLTAATRKTEAETEKIGGADTENTIAQTEYTRGAQTRNTNQDTKVKEVQESNIVWDNELKEVAADIANKTKGFTVQQKEQEAIGAGVDNAVKRLGMKLDRRKVNALEETVRQQWDRLILERREVTVKELSQAVQESFLRDNTKLRGEELTQREYEAISQTVIGAVGLVAGQAPVTTRTETDIYNKKGKQKGSSVTTSRRN